MASEYRLHSASFLFRIAGSLRQLVVPVLLLLVGASSTGLGAPIVLVPYLIVYAISSIVSCAAVRYTFESHELTIRHGLLARREQHIPYSRIHNIDAIETVFHRALGVADVRIETGGGEEPEARLSVVTRAALEAIRREVQQRRAALAIAPTDHAAVEPASDAAPDVLLTLGVPDLLLHGFIQGRGWLVFGAILGFLSQFPPVEAFLMQRLEVDPSGSARTVLQTITGLTGAEAPVLLAMVAVAFVVVVALMLRLASMVWFAVRLFGFRLTRMGDDVRAEYGLLTRVSATIPLARIQTVTIHATPLHRLLGRTSVRVDTAGGIQGGQAAGREALAPIITVTNMHALLRQILPGVSIGDVTWHGPDPRAHRRVVRLRVAAGALAAIPLVWIAGWIAGAALVVLAVMFAFRASRIVRGLGWGIAGDVVSFRSGWLARQITLVRTAKIQSVLVRETPFDRRWGMAAVSADTAGPGGTGDTTMRYLPSGVAEELRRRLAAGAAATFKW